MPRVPIYRTNETFRAAPTANPGSVAPNRSAQQIAAAGMQIGEGVLKQIRENDETNLLAFSNAMLQNKQQLLNDPDSGFLNSRGINAQNGQPQVQQQWQEMTKQAMDGLPARLQAKAQQMAAKYTLDFDQDVGSHVRTQTDAFRAQTYKDTLSTAANEAALNYGDFTRVDEQAQTASIATRIERQRLGTPDENAEKDAASSVYRAALERQAGIDPIGAQQRYIQLLDDGKLTGSDAAAFDQVIRPIEQDVQAQQAADVVNNGGTLDTGVDASIDDSIIKLESGGNAGAKNSNSSAAGLGQFTDATWLEMVRKNRPDLAKGKTDPELLAMKTDPELSRQMVGAYREDNTRRLRASGVAASAENVYAAHHFGPAGGVAFAKAAPDTPIAQVLSPDQIAANPYLQGKTKAQVVANWQQRGLPATGGAQFTGPATSEAEALDRTKLIADPRLRQQAQAKVRMDWGIRDAQEAAAEKAASERIFTALTNNTDPSARLSQIITPQDYAQAVKSGKVNAFENYRRAILEGRLIQDNPVLADTLYRESALTPDAFQKRDLHALSDQLSASTLTTLVNRQNDLRTKGAAAQKDWMSDEDRLNYGYTMLGVGKETDASGAGSETKNAPRNKLRGEFRIAYRDAVVAFKQGVGRNPTPDEADKLMRESAKRFSQRWQSGALGVSADASTIDANRPGLYSNAAQYQTQISQEDRDAVSQAYQAKYGRRPTDAWITQYIAQKQSGKGGAQ